MTKAKSKTAGASTKSTTAASNGGGLKQSKSLASKTVGDVARQQKKPAVKKMDQAVCLVAATKEISPSTKILAASETAATEAANSIQSQQRLNRAADHHSLLTRMLTTAKIVQCQVIHAQAASWRLFWGCCAKMAGRRLMRSYRLRDGCRIQRELF